MKYKGDSSGQKKKGSKNPAIEGPYMQRDKFYYPKGEDCINTEGFYMHINLIYHFGSLYFFLWN